VVGTEPSWSLTFEGSGVQFSEIGSAVQPLDIESKSVSDSKREYSLSNGKLTLNNQACSDGMSDSLYGWTANFKRNDGVLKGCAILSNMDATQYWQGNYQATSQKSQGFTISLQLNADHTAVTQYTYDDGSSTRTERGYWQQHSADQVQVVSTYHQGQRLIAERIFTRTNSTLSTEFETINGVKYPLIDGGLSLFRTKP
jgi:putative lipoprotein